MAPIITSTPTRWHARPSATSYGSQPSAPRMASQSWPATWPRCARPAARAAARGRRRCRARHVRQVLTSNPYSPLGRRLRFFDCVAAVDLLQAPFSFASSSLTVITSPSDLINSAVARHDAGCGDESPRLPSRPMAAVARTRVTRRVRADTRSCREDRGSGGAACPWPPSGRSGRPPSAKACSLQGEGGARTRPASGRTVL